MDEVGLLLICLIRKATIDVYMAQCLEMTSEQNEFNMACDWVGLKGIGTTSLEQPLVKSW